MAVDNTNLNRILAEMGNLYKEDPIAAVRSQSFIKKLHDFCKTELELRGFSKDGEIPLPVKVEAKVLTSHKYKDVDIAVIHPTSGPLLTIGVRSQMSSLGKNFLNYYEMEVGDAYAIHERFPMCVCGMLYLHPKTDVLPDKPLGAFDYERAAKMFALISGREKPEDSYGHYEEIAYMNVEFNGDVPALDSTFPENENLRVDEFFDKLYARFLERNFHLLK